MAETILIVDDEPPLLRLLIRVLEREGLRVLSAQDGEAAVELFAEHADEIDVLVLDVIIPPKGAAQVLDAVLERKPDLALVLTSGDRLEPDLRQRLQERGGVFLHKPFLPRLLLRTVREMASADGAPAGGNRQP